MVDIVVVVVVVVEDVEDIIVVVVDEVEDVVVDDATVVEEVGETGSTVVDVAPDLYRSSFSCGETHFFSVQFCSALSIRSSVIHPLYPSII